MDEILTNIKERILKVAEYKGIRKEKFIENLNQKYSNYRGNSKNSAPSSEVIAEISTKYPEISLRWLLTGTGKMVKDITDTNQHITTNLLTDINESPIETVLRDKILLLQEIKEYLTLENKRMQEDIKNLKNQIEELKGNEKKTSHL
ncbi:MULTISPECIES: hypothetical protein [unclassified Sphingobacterium]|uniref:hypothetical protein n=1 Tax=unclassified Sphingobacterium TaxID=2609468 RepID=UPI0025D7D0D9|nr:MULTISPECIES: hypothetical protein [unclassified Sphingobacterium]